MDLFAIDDSAQTKPSRDGMGPLVAVGGLYVPGAAVRDLEHGLHALCDSAGFPEGEEFKWSPPRDSWMRTELVGPERADFQLSALRMAKEAGAVAIVAIEDTSKGLAQRTSSSHEDDVTMLFLERAHHLVPEDGHAMVVFDRPGGKGKDDFEFLAGCIERLRDGTAYAKLDRLALALSTDSKLSRLVQLADVVTACTTAHVGGESTYTPLVFRDGILPMLRTDNGCTGGRGLKLHPDFRYGNLYHWLLGDPMCWKKGRPWALPSHQFTSYFDSADVA